MNKELIAQRLAESILGRKDKDLMQDTGGISKGRDREPINHPPREDLKNRYRTKDLSPSDRDTDTDNDADKTKDKDTKTAAFPFFPNLPIPTYSDEVLSALINILADERKISEKAFDLYDSIMAEAKSVIESNDSLIKEFEIGSTRPQLCAEVLYGFMASNGGFENNLINPPIGRVANNANQAGSILSRFPHTLKALVQKAG